MAELGSGNGSGYPAALDTDSILETSATFAVADIPNDLAAAIIAVQTELGLDPAGSTATVKARLDIISAANGTPLIPGGLASARPSPTTDQFEFYFSQDLGILEFSDGTQWLPVMVG